MSSALCGNSKVRLLRISGPPRARIRTYSKRLSIARSAHPSSEEIGADGRLQFSVLSSQFSVFSSQLSALSHDLSVSPTPVQSCHLERSRRDPYTLSGGKGA